MLPADFLVDQRRKLVQLQTYHQSQSTRDSGVENFSDKKPLLRQINNALTMIADGDYGYCEDCDAEIPIPRLNMIPQATRCASCQEQQEKLFRNGRYYNVPPGEQSLR